MDVRLSTAPGPKGHLDFALRRLDTCRSSVLTLTLVQALQMRFLRNQARLTIAMFIVIVMLAAACGHTSAGVGVAYQPDLLPLQFSVSFNIGPNGSISLAGSVGVITPGGIFSLQADVETNLQPATDETLLIIRHHQGQGVVDSVYHIETSEEVIVTLNGHVVIDVSNHKIVINAIGSKVESIAVTNAPVPAPPAAASTPPAPGTVQLLRTVQGSGMNIDNVSWSPAGTTFVDAGYNVQDNVGNFACEIRRASDGAVVSSLQVPDYWLNTVSWAPNGQYIAGGYDSDVQIWNASTGSQVSQIGYWASMGVSWSPDSQYVVTSGQEQPIVWNVANGSQISTYVPTDGLIDGAVWSPKGNLIVSNDDIWNGMTGQVVRTYVGGDQNGFPVSSWSPNGKEIASIDGDGIIVAWDATTGATIWQGQQDLTANSLSWSPNGKYIAWLGDGQAGILDAATGNPVATFGDDVLSSGADNAAGSNAPAIAWSPNGQYIATTGGSAPVQIWQAPDWSY